jgi:hypothetical protein
MPITKSALAIAVALVTPAFAASTRNPGTSNAARPAGTRTTSAFASKITHASESSMAIRVVNSRQGRAAATLVSMKADVPKLEEMSRSLTLEHPTGEFPASTRMALDLAVARLSAAAGSIEHEAMRQARPSDYLKSAAEAYAALAKVTADKQFAASAVRVVLRAAELDANRGAAEASRELLGRAAALGFKYEVPVEPATLVKINRVNDVREIRSDLEHFDRQRAADLEGVAPASRKHLH